MTSKIFYLFSPHLLTLLWCAIEICLGLTPKLIKYYETRPHQNKKNKNNLEPKKPLQLICKLRIEFKRTETLLVLIIMYNVLKTNVKCSLFHWMMGGGGRHWLGPSRRPNESPARLPHDQVATQVKDWCVEERYAQSMLLNWSLT